jgi:DNA-binding SARP family transcriptional activator/predicted ATPase
MNSTLEITLLGPLSVHANGKLLVCASKKALWMAAYVLMQKTPQSRSALANLFWPNSPRNSPDARALGSLRVALTKLPAPLQACLDIQRERIGVAIGAAFTIDVDRFVANCSGNDRADPAQLEAAVNQYRGDFFEGVTPDEAPTFFDWLQVERVRLRQLAHGAHLTLARHLREQGQREAARETANRWLIHQPADEAVHRLLMTWLADDAGNDHALAQYDVYRRALAVADGVTPSPAMVAFAERLRGHPVGARIVGQRAGRGEGRSADHRGEDSPARLAPATSFIGRAAELAAIQATLADPACRLLTLRGMGGAGKTRLALAALDAMSAKASDGVFIAALDEVATPALFAQTLARACGLQPAGTASPMDLLIAFFQRRNALLLLDNLEHLLRAPEADGGVDGGGVEAMVARLLAATGPRFKILATSREPLKLQEEWVHELHGLAFPAPDAENIETFAAIQLFAQRARQVNAAFSIGSPANDHAKIAAIATIAALLEGLPLGLELAASWSGSLTPAQLLDELRAHATLIASQHVNRVARHRTLGAAVAFSWAHLSDELRQALNGVSVLTGTFSTDAAASIGSATPTMLKALADKSLLTATADGRWHTHEVVRQFAWEQIAHAPSPVETVTRRRDTYYMGWLREVGTRIIGPDEPAALLDIDRESANLRAAWESSARTGNFAALEAGATAWFDFLECRNYIAEGIAAATCWLAATRDHRMGRDEAHPLYYLGLFQRFASRNNDALTTLQEVDAMLTQDAARLRVQTRAALAFTLLLLGRLADAEAAATSASELARALNDATLQASACRVLGLCQLQSGRRQEGRERQREALAFATQIGRPTLLAAAHNNLAMAENHMGNYAEAEAGYRSALDSWRALQAIANIGRGLHNLGVVSRRRGDHAEALARYREALEVLRKSGDRNLIALNLMSTADVLLRLGKPEEARQSASQALDMAERDGHMLPALDARIVLAQAATQQGEHKTAARHLATVLDAALAHQFTNVLADAIVSAARLAAVAVPAIKAEALGWARTVATAENVSASIRDDAAAFANSNSANSNSTDSNSADINTPSRADLSASNAAAPRALPLLAADAHRALVAIEAA